MKKNLVLCNKPKRSKETQDLENLWPHNAFACVRDQAIKDHCSCQVQPAAAAAPQDSPMR